MAEPADLSPTIVESLYCEALVLADEARAVFDLSGRLDLAGEDEDIARVALS
jgi:regulator of CtrA degradation